MALNQPEPLSMAPVARMLAMDRTTLTAALKPLEKRGLIGVEASPTDRRSRRLRLTEAGNAALLDALPISRQTYANIEATLPKVGLEALKVLLQALA
nr:MarR family transcriptional regulator [Belnapia moabensis]